LLCGEGTHITKENNKVNLVLVIKEAKEAGKHSTQKRKTGIYYSQTYFFYPTYFRYIIFSMFLQHRGL